jgi:GNAT superfamily N-acetyltransferase
MPKESPSGMPIVDQMQENMVAYFRLFAGLPRMTCIDQDDLFWFVSARGEPGNYLLRARFPDGEAEERIDAILGEIGRHTGQLDWMVFPACRPADLGARLEARGMPGGLGGNWMSTKLPVQPDLPPMPEAFRIEQVRTLEELEVWRQISSAGFGIDVQIHAEAYARHGFGPDAISLHYTGFLGDQPVTSATLLLAGGIAGIWDVSTPPELRGKGYGGAITLHLMHEAAARGYHQAWVWSSKMGRPVYERVGFVLADFGVREHSRSG